MTTELKQKWVCPKCKRKDRTIFKEDPNLNKCGRCGTDMETAGIIKITKGNGLKMPE